MGGRPGGGGGASRGRRRQRKHAAGAQNGHTRDGEDALHECHGPAAREQLGLRLDPGAERRRGEEVGRQADRRERALGARLPYTFDAEHDVGEAGEHAAMAGVHGIAVLVADREAVARTPLSPRT
jgi:hypothetical protein